LFCNGGSFYAPKSTVSDLTYVWLQNLLLPFFSHLPVARMTDLRRRATDRAMQEGSNFPPFCPAMPSFYVGDSLVTARYQHQLASPAR